jgi:FkbM family methyltransferase
MRRPLEVRVSGAGIKYPLHLRLRTSDVSLFSEIIVNEEYDSCFSRSPEVIVDAGANIGLTSVFYANKYPEARIVAVEPALSNYVMLQKNAAPYSNILPIHGALWKENKDICVSDPGAGQWGFQTHDGSELAPGKMRVYTRGITMDRLMSDCGLNHVDILKIDIEGSEREVFGNSAPWIDKVGVVVVELHDRVRPGCSRSAYLATGEFEVEWHKGETTYFVRKEYAGESQPQLGGPQVSIWAYPIQVRYKLPFKIELAT